MGASSEGGRLCGLVAGVAVLSALDVLRLAAFDVGALDALVVVVVHAVAALVDVTGVAFDHTGADVGVDAAVG